MERQIASRFAIASALAFASFAVARADSAALPFAASATATGGYAVSGTLAATDAPAGTSVSFYGRPPTKTEMAPSPGADGLFFFHMDLNAAVPVHVGSGTMDVTFAGKLDPRYRYQMTLARTIPNVVDVPGTLHGNTLRFALPAFVIPTNTRVIGEVDGDPESEP